MFEVFKNLFFLVTTLLTTSFSVIGNFFAAFFGKPKAPKDNNPTTDSSGTEPDVDDGVELTEAERLEAERKGKAKATTDDDTLLPGAPTAPNLGDVSDDFTVKAFHIIQLVKGFLETQPIAQAQAQTSLSTSTFNRAILANGQVDVLTQLCDLLGISSDAQATLPEELEPFITNVLNGEILDNLYDNSFFIPVMKRMAEKYGATDKVGFVRPASVIKETNGRIILSDPNVITAAKNTGKNCVIMPVNTQRRNGNGTAGSGHWNIAIIDFKTKKFFYFEPNIKQNGKDENQIYHATAQLLADRLGGFEVIKNTVSVQKDEFSCGPISIAFVDGLLRNLTTNLTALREQGLSGELVTTFLSSTVNAGIVKTFTDTDEGKVEAKTETQIMGAAFRACQIDVAKEVVQNMLEVLNLSNPQQSLAK